jgi:hypothetical protein
LKEYEEKPGDQLPELMILALPADHTGGTNPALPTPRAMVADKNSINEKGIKKLEGEVEVEGTSGWVLYQ